MVYAPCFPGLGVYSDRCITTTFPVEGFNESLEGLPLLTFKTVGTYMVCCVGAKRQLSTAKPLVKGFNFYKSGHVLTVKSCNEDTRSYVKSQVLPSMKKDLCLIIVWKNGLVQKAYCACSTGIDGRCIHVHVAVTLFALEEFCKLRAKQEETRKACTSQKCKWNVPR